ncbi:DUF1289 domain-containing protein [Pseudoalteromonas sp. SMS1]|uniref:DUF1289 domain-containing protein n=1 Tax=Pseudoalteromonas sp. SMS1 TaxID=2908894 RepID=UPI001F3068CB|nr:DUF1289 domain-containing protein [Pseudoalteromonas sp. SMS1]MCF2859966.1 DUF1289 domain-containing protein [Pseudoalteromonas sp. SMS1]
MVRKPEEKQPEVPSPCVRNCCLDNNDICVGCLRHIDEIVGWGSKSDQEKSAILTRCESRKEVRIK